MLHKIKLTWMFLFAALIFLFTGTASAHCDSVEGPVVKASKKALETGNINYVLVWVKSDDEKEIKDMFNKVIKVRTLNPEVKELADNYFFETVVRVHRMGEGVGYTGIIPAGIKPAEGIEAADIAIETNSIDKILSHLDEKYHSKLKELFDELQSRRNYDINDVEAGREYVESYVVFIHHIEALFNGQEPKEEVHHNH